MILHLQMKKFNKNSLFFNLKNEDSHNSQLINTPPSSVQENNEENNNNLQEFNN